MSYQDILVYVIVMAAVVFVARTVVRQFSGARAGCTKCDRCETTSENASQPTSLIQIEPVPKDQE
ncbi:MAG: FeoB-associated Cys-rich membrane protein [candidate division Zixibacteria bacterium]|nr:FeoB-associated Cys-rich membrane protein [candidate division Zixibacteria bacterium]